MSKIRILGIDPGFGRTGIAIIEKDNRNISLVHSECFETKKEDELPIRLAQISEHVRKICNKYKPKRAGVETLLWSKNKKTALGVAQARGTILSEIISSNIEVEEINPNTVKISITGYGKSDKKQIITMLHKLIDIKHKIKHDDEYDAIAIALSCAYRRIIPN